MKPRRKYTAVVINRTKRTRYEIDLTKLEGSDIIRSQHKKCKYASLTLAELAIMVKANKI